MQISGNHSETRIRSAFELLPILENFENIANFEELCRIFPEARQYDRGQGTDLLFVLGRVMIELTDNPVGQLYSLLLLKEALQDPARAENIRASYEFDDSDLARYTGSCDVFSMEIRHHLSTALAEKNAQLEERSKELARMKRTLSWRITHPLRAIAGWSRKQARK